MVRGSDRGGPPSRRCPPIVPHLLPYSRYLNVGGSGMGKLAEAGIAKLRAERDETLRTLLSLTEEECQLPAEWSKTRRTINFLLRQFTTHQLDHLQHLHKMLREQGRWLSEAEILLSKSQATQGELEALILSLSDAEFTRVQAQEGGWSPKDLVEHVAEIERDYRAEIQKSRDAARS